jgi:hypothetical protein
VDPGHPPNGQQVVGPNQTTISYDQGSRVFFQCNRPGFSLDNPYPIECVTNANNNGLAWNATITPRCIGNDTLVLCNL